MPGLSTGDVYKVNQFLAGIQHYVECPPHISRILPPLQGLLMTMPCPCSSTANNGTVEEACKESDHSVHQEVWQRQYCFIYTQELTLNSLKSTIFVHLSDGLYFLCVY